MDSVLACSGGGMMGGWWPVWIVINLAFWGTLLWLGTRFLAPWLHGVRPGPERVLAERFADGAIDEDEYRRRLEVIRSDRARVH